ncbi:ArsR/SmtB family transcription factor [Saccharibacillus alkalitolerans]|uniref:Winged helix-turn-helix transcriptional regulator n=1 Tax=Saccharibacillus alkalitolerans TaxID=2705290 RepID=A0ABX0F4W5_9BACL|nr:metalloregulator ArsR/SmtB family transcription factor [Saccharibacillus alkalitolerans]NGZ75054.1 winged helix-turn-helix transcriptional regulator [Saccharibacillus alkalitolerans]
MDPIGEMAEHLKLLGDRTRLTMLALLRQREWCVCEFVEIFDMSQPAVSQHMRKLKKGGLVREERRGQWVYYSPNIEDKPYIAAILGSLPEPAEILRLMGKRQPEAACGPESSICCS